MSNVKESISKRLMSLIMTVEGFSAYAYYDTNGYAIGFGNHYYANNKPVLKGDFITLEDGYNLAVVYLNRLFKSIKDKTKTSPVISQSKLEALTSLAYNGGLAGLFKSSLFLDNVALGKDIKKETFLSYKTNGNVVLRKRRLEEFNLYYCDANLDVQKDFDRRYNFDDIYNKKKKVGLTKSKYDKLYYYDKDNSTVGQITTVVNKVNAVLLNNWLVVIALAAVAFIIYKFKK